MTEIIAFAEIEEFIKRIRDQKQKIAFTNGCFDLLHRGHVQYLEEARKTADMLVVGLNSDHSVRRLKGEDRPYTNQDDRAYILSRLQAVDVVCVFEQDTPLELIKKVQPDVLVKGGDYQLHEIVGRDVVEAKGGEVLTISLIAGRSTTNILNKIKTSESTEKGV